MSFWECVPHTLAQHDNAEHTARAAASLRQVHKALADFSGALPNFWEKIDHCHGLLETQSALSALAPTDRQFLMAVYTRLRSALDRLPLRLAPIHGDAHSGNVFMTADGAIWNDLEDACFGPPEWDIAWLHEVDLAQFEPINRDALVALSHLRGFCVSVWCWDLASNPQKREAAKYHLSYLRAQTAMGALE